jgi:vitamin B12 transporter
LGSYDWKLLTFTSSYSWISRQSSYKDAVADASFYALNYPLHRITAGAIFHPTQEVDFRANTEWRKQEENNLRSNSDTTYTLTSVAATWRPIALPGFSFALVADNITKENFEEIPGVPGVGRTVAGIASWTW